MCTYIDPDGERRLREAYAAAGMKLDFGKSCLRFKSLDRFLPEAVIPILEQSSVEALIGSYEAARGGELAAPDDKVRPESGPAGRDSPD